MNQPQGLSLMDSLKEAVRECHARMEKLPFIEALTSGQLPLDSYLAQLRAMAVIHGTLNHELSLLSCDEIRTLLLDRPSRLVHLRKDLSIFDPLLIPEIEETLGHTRKIAERIRRDRVEQPIALLGILYVLEGMTLGNAVHLPDVLRLFSDQTSGKAYYYRGYGENTNDCWSQLSSMMNAMTLDEKDRAQVVEAALEFFDQLEALYATFYPLDGGARVFTAGMLNPEAGDHAVPQPAAEIRAAENAARRCREDYPYFDERYQERGKSFAKSDAAWLVTLAELPAAHLVSQVEWLGRVLGNRGIPRITLERQLELLHEELVAMDSEKKPYKCLLEVAEMLKKERFRSISEPVFNALASEFHQYSERDLQARFKGTGALIVSAVCDQAAGIDNAVSSLIDWLTDAGKFSPQWIAAVNIILDKARKSVKS